MIQQHLIDTAEKVLLEYLAPERAKEAAQRIGTDGATLVNAEMAEAVQRVRARVEAALTFEGLEAGLTPPAAAAPTATASATVKGGRKGGGSSSGGASARAPRKPATPTESGKRELSPKSRLTMSFKKALHHARNRAVKGAPLPYDAFLLKAAEEGRVVSVETAKRQAAAAERKAKSASSVPAPTPATAPATATPTKPNGTRLLSEAAPL